MQINTEKWGQESEWQVETNLSTATWQDTDLLFYNGKYRALSEYRTNGVFDYNTPIDYSIAYSAHAADTKMPLADMAIYDYQGTKKYTLETNNGWFFTNQIAESISNWNYYELLSAFETGSPTNLYELGGAYRWAPDAVNYSDIYPRPSNLNRRLRPIVKFSPKSFFGVVYVQLVKNDYTDMTTVSLKTLKNNIDTYKDTHFIMKAYMRMYAYNGRVSQDGNYNNFSLKSLTNFGVSTTQPLKIGTKDLITYYQTVGSSYYTFPIAGTLEYVRNYYYSTNHYGVRVAPQTTDSGGGDEYMQGVTMAHLVDSVNVQYYYDPNSTGRTYILQVKIPITTGVIDELYKGAAAYGFFFSDDVNGLNVDTTNVARWLNENMYCGVLDENGVGHGEFTKGFGNAANPVFLWDSNQDSPYDPSRPPSPVDPNTYSNITSFNFITEGAAMTVRYVLDGANVDKLLSDLWTINASIAQGGDFEYFDGKIKDEYLTTNPIDCIVSLIRYPFNIPYQIQPLQSYVKLGKTEGSAKGWTTVYISNQINFEGKDIFPRFGNSFLDYEPYTTYELYVPFCGTTKIRAADILGHTLNVTMLIDLITGSCTAYIKADQLVIETLQGSCGVQQQISGTDTATMNANIYNGILAQKQAKTGMIAQAASALLPSNWVNPAGYAAKGEQAETSYKQATYAIEHMETPVHSQGAASPLLGWIQEFDARLLIYYPEGDVIDGAIPPSFKATPLAAFGHLKGFATVSPGTVGTFRSSNAAFLSGDIIADDIPCTLSERNRIKSMFADGVYLPPL